MSKFSSCGFDRLSVPIRSWYVAEMPKVTSLDRDALELVTSVAKIKGIQDGLKSAYRRRSYTNSYLTTPDDPKCKYLADFDQIAHRELQYVHDVFSRHHRGWYVDSYMESLCIGVVLRMPSRKDRSSAGTRSKESRMVWLAGHYVTDCDGVTVYTIPFETREAAARFADSCAEQYAEECREENERYEAEERLIELKADLKEKRQHCLNLIREYKQEREGIIQSLRDVLLDAIWDEVREIRKLREEVTE